MAGKAAAARDRDVPRPNCYIYAKRGWGGGARSVSVGYAGTHGVIKPSGPLRSTSVTGKRSVGPVSEARISGMLEKLNAP